MKAASVAAAAATFLAAGNAQAAAEVAQLADGRGLELFLPIAAAGGWVLFNILGPLGNQISAMETNTAGGAKRLGGAARAGKRGLVAGLGLGAATLLAASSADAATEVAQLADSRGLELLLPLTAAIGWVLFNILGPLGNQISAMESNTAGNAKRVGGAPARGAKRGLIAGLGLGAATLLATQSAEAATEVAQLADSRGLELLLPLGAAIAWVLFNILGPLGNQISAMDTNTAGNAKRVSGAKSGGGKKGGKK